MEKAITASVLAARGMLVHRDNSHVILGYDFMVDTNLNIWLIECN